MVIKDKKVYYCGYCNKYYLSERFCLKHEDRCKGNPKNKRKCLENCKFLERVDIEYCDGGENEHSSNCFKCSLTKQLMYHPSIEYKEWFDTYGAEDQEPMPLICDKFKKFPMIFDD